jgi:hypothetical protein
MNNEALKQFTNRIDELENRIDTIEEKKRKEGRGVWATTLRIGEFIGIFGGFVALFMAAALDLPQRMKERIGKPDTVMKPAEQLAFTWTQEGKLKRLNFNWPILLHNRGEGLDTVADWDARISLPKAMGSIESFNLEKICATPPERDRCIAPPLEVEVGKARRIEMSISSKLTSEKQQAFLKPGPHKLTLNLNFEEPGSKIRRNRFINWLAVILKLDSKEPQPKPPIEYCFWLGPESAIELKKTGHRSETYPVPGC